MVVLFKILQVVLALSGLILIHELGHFTFSKAFGIRVEKFYLFFDVGGKSILKFRRGETEYGIGWLPLGGYCKIAGMVDESMDLEALKKKPESWEFRTHPAWQRLLVMAGGVLFNFIFAILSYALIAGIWGSSYIPNDSACIEPSPLAADMGFRRGDRILSLDDYVPENFASLPSDIIRREVLKASVLRGEDTVSIYFDRSRVREMLDTPMLFGLALPFQIDSLCAGPNAAVLGKGDFICALDGAPVRFLQDASPILFQKAGRQVVATVERDGVCREEILQVDTLGRIGVFVTPPVVRTRKYTFFECFPAGVKMTSEMISGYLKDLKLVATPSTGAYKSVGSFIAIGQVFPEAWDWFQFLSIVALLSVMLGIMNLIPIPGLDGGHILFTLFEMLTGKKPSDRFLAVAQTLGMLLLLALMFLAFGNDITRLLK